MTQATITSLIAKQQELAAQAATLQKQIEQVAKQNRQDVIAAIKKMMAENGIAAAELVEHRGRPAGSKNHAKYVNIKTGETWSGVGRTPLWMQEINRDA